MKKLFVYNSEDTFYDNELNHGYERLSVSESISYIQLSDLSVNFLLAEGFTMVISNQIPVEWIYTLKGMGIVSLIFGDATLYHHKADIVIDYLGSDSIKYFSGEKFSLRNKDFNFEEISDLIRKLDWDSVFFGYPIAFIGSKYLTVNINKTIDRYVKENQFKLTQYLCNCHDDLSVKIAEQNGYHFTDIRLTFNYKIKRINEVSEIIEDKCRIADMSHLPALMSMTTNLYKDSRYFYDGNFDVKKINQFYSEWMVKAIKGVFDHECYAWFENEQPIAFCTINYSFKAKANIGLFGVSQEHLGKGIGKKLLSSVIHRLAVKEIENIDVVTQGRNYAAQQLYQSVGFKTLTTELWYHKWN